MGVQGPWETPASCLWNMSRVLLLSELINRAKGGQECAEATSPPGQVPTRRLLFHLLLGFVGRLAKKAILKHQLEEFTAAIGSRDKAGARIESKHVPVPALYEEPP